MPSPTCLRPSDSSAATCQPFRSRVLLVVGAEPTASKQLHVTWAIVEGWRLVATTRQFEGTSVTINRQVQSTVGLVRLP